MSRFIPFFDLLRRALFVLLIGGATLSAQAQMAQSPLLTQSGRVEPNVLLVYDDSGSMGYGYIYQYGTRDTQGLGLLGPSGTTSGADSTTGTWSPDVNRIAYDPRKRYKERLNADGTTQTFSVVPDAFKVFFYRDPVNGNVNRAWTGDANANTSAGYFGTTSTLPAYTATAAMVEVGATPNLTYPNTVSATGAFLFPKFLGRTDCAGSSCTLAEERANYDRWKAFHSTRHKVGQTGLIQAFYGQGDSFRLGWAKMNGDLTATTPKVQSGVGLFTSARKAAFYSWLGGINPNGGTLGVQALNNAGKYFTFGNAQGPWSNNPSTGTFTVSGSLPTADSTHLACRRSYTLYMTDGYWNDSSPPSANADNIDSTTITGTLTVNGVVTTRSYKYTGSVADANTRLYLSTAENNMADIAMYYWVNDLRPDLQNRVTPVPATSLSRGNPSFWQNMGTYAIGLGVYGTLPQTATTIAQLTSGAIDWPTPTRNYPNTVDDMWHATINGRGQMVSAKDTDELTEAIEDMFEEINRVTATQSGVAASTQALNTGTRKYTPNYTTGAWTGNVRAIQLDAKSGADKYLAWQVVGTGVPGTYTGTPPAPTTFNGIPAHGVRNIVAWNGSSYGNFNASNSYVMAGSPTGVYGANANLINYLRGDQSNESPAGARYRAREYLLGDIVNSTPVFIGGGTVTAGLTIGDVVMDMGYQNLPTGTPGRGTYRTYVTAKAARSEGVLFVGANDGMLHGFRDGPVNAGSEVFAFVPKAVMPIMDQLSKRTYSHKYFVDGPNIEVDACLGGSSCTWTNLLIGTTGAGPKSVFALDVTTPLEMTTTSVKWEIDPSTSGFATLGHVLSPVQAGYTKSGQWVAVFGNGYKSAGEKAVLYIVDLNTGALIKAFQVGSTGANGLGGVRLVRDANRVIIGAYAGDLDGKMWKFDLSDASPANWIVGLSGSALWTGSTSQPITQAPVLVTHPLGGNIVAFGTGKLYELADATSTTRQAMYGVWDSVPFGTTPTPSGVALTNTSTLVLQTISAAIAGQQLKTTFTSSGSAVTSTVTLNYYSVSRNPVDWSTKRGWYIEWPTANSGQRVVYPPKVLEGKIVAVDTMTPISDIADDPCVQSNRGKAWNYVIDALTGGRPSTNVFDTNGNGRVDLNDAINGAIVSGHDSSADGQTTTVTNTETSTGLNTVKASLGGTEQMPDTWISCATLNNCAFVNRSWRQLFPR